MSRIALAWSRLDKSPNETANAPRQTGAGLGRIDGKNIAMRFPTESGENAALDELDISIAPGEFLALLGPSTNRSMES